MQVKTKSPKETQKVGEKLAKKLSGGEVIALFGNLGSGKTVFVQGLAKGLGIKRKITSPTFVFMRSYPFSLHRKALMFYHLDLYRGESDKDFEALGLEEIFAPDAIVVLEWAEKIKKELPKKRIEIKLEKVDDRTRRITVTGN